MYWDKNVEEIMENIDALVHKRKKLIDEYYTSERELDFTYGRALDFISGDCRNGDLINFEEMYQNYKKTAEKYLKKIEKTGKQVFCEMTPLSNSISNFHIYLYLLSRFIFITNKKVDWILFEIQMPVIPAEYSCQSGIKEIFDKDEIQKLENIFFRGLKTFNEIVFFENHFIFSDGTVFFEEYWEKIKKNVKSDIYKMVGDIGKILMDYYLNYKEEYNNTVDRVKEYLNKNLSYYKSVYIDINEIGKDKTEYRVFQIKQDVNCEHGCNIY